MPMEDSTKAVLEQVFVSHHEAMLHDRESRVAGQNFTMEALRLMHENTMMMLGAAATQELRTSAQAREILQSRAASDQPGAGPTK